MKLEQYFGFVVCSCCFIMYRIFMQVGPFFFALASHKVIVRKAVKMPEMLGAGVGSADGHRTTAAPHTEPTIEEPFAAFTPNYEEDTP